MTDKTKPPCPHLQFATRANIFRLKDSGQFQMEVNVNCTDCGEPFRFLGLPMGLDLGGATMSVDMLTANLAIRPLTPKEKQMVAIMNPPKGGDSA